MPLKSFAPLGAFLVDRLRGDHPPPDLPKPDAQRPRGPVCGWLQPPTPFSVLHAHPDRGGHQPRARHRGDGFSVCRRPAAHTLFLGAGSESRSRFQQHLRSWRAQQERAGGPAGVDRTPPRRGGRAYLAVDGPRGPRNRVNKGIAVLAKQTGGRGSSTWWRFPDAAGSSGTCGTDSRCPNPSPGSMVTSAPRSTTSREKAWRGSVCASRSNSENSSWNTTGRRPAPRRQRP